MRQDERLVSKKDGRSKWEREGGCPDRFYHSPELKKELLKKNKLRMGHMGKSAFTCSFFHPRNLGLIATISHLAGC